MTQYEDATVVLPYYIFDTKCRARELHFMA